ncbi:MAG: redoxin domain-containing protein [Flavobacteriales bacterium]|nr:redoxin domain-containing protein [Flavobacteriales bacterium]
MAKVNVGDTAPDFELKDKDGNLVKLSDFRGEKSVVVYFYPKDETPGCTAQACSFRDSYQDFTDAGAEVIGISSDGASAHSGFAANHRLPFILLSDPAGKARKAYGAYDLLGLIPGRVTFVINKEGKVIHKFDSQLSPTKHIKESLDAIKKQ